MNYLLQIIVQKLDNQLASWLVNIVADKSLSDCVIDNIWRINKK